MSGSPHPGPAFSFRRLPLAIYVALGVNVVGALVVLIATLRSSGESFRRYEAIQRWLTLDGGCDVAAAILLPLGLLELARRHTGSQRVLAQVAAGLGFANLSWLLLQPLTLIFEPSFETLTAVYDWHGRGIGAIALAGAVLLTIAADAWRRVPIAAAGLIVIAATGPWVPGIGKTILGWIGDDLTSRQLYGIARLGVHVTALLFVLAALAAAGRDPVPEPRTAASSFRLARGMLLFRIAAAMAVAAVATTGPSGDAARVAAFAGPAVAVLTMIVFAIALQRIAGARVEGLPRLAFSLGAALTLWWGTIQFLQITALIGEMKDPYPSEQTLEAAQWFSIAGPIAVTIALTLVGSAIASFARERGDDELRSVATGRTVAFLTTTLGSIGLQAWLADATTPGGALLTIMLGAIGAVLGLAILAGLLGRAAEAIERSPGIPSARVL